MIQSNKMFNRAVTWSETRLPLSQNVIQTKKVKHMFEYDFFHLLTTESRDTGL